MFNTIYLLTKSAYNYTIFYNFYFPLHLFQEFHLTWKYSGAMQFTPYNVHRWLLYLKQAGRTSLPWK